MVHIFAVIGSTQRFFFRFRFVDLNFDLFCGFVQCVFIISIIDLQVDVEGTGLFVYDFVAEARFFFIEANVILMKNKNNIYNGEN